MPLKFRSGKFRHQILSAENSANEFYRLKIEPPNFSLRKVYLTYARAKYIIYARA